MATESLLNDLQVSATNQLIEALVDSEHRMRRRVNLLTEVVFELDTEGHLVFLNRAWESLMGIPPDALLGGTFKHYILPEDRGIFELALATATRVPEMRRTVIRFAHESGSTLWLELSIVVIDDGHVGALHDITEQKRIQDQLEYIAHYDILTKMPNRALLSDRIAQAISSCQRHGRTLAVAFLDLDGFKSINDQYGHDAGDQLLATLGKRLKGALREGDSIARIGGDEFVVVLVDLDQPRQCEPVLKRLLDAASEAVPVGNHQLKVSASIGVTSYPQDNADADQLIRHADQAMYVAKQTGKNRYHFFDVAYDSAVRAHGETLDRIQQALRDQEFVLYYQPQINIRNHTAYGAEALIRWQHPRDGVLLPGAFLPVIENHPISLQIGEWVIDSALAQLARWAEAGIALEVSVNVSAYQLLDESFVDTVARLLAKYPSVSPAALTMEILETSALGDTERVSRVIQTCQAMGLAFALDDFGTGYSSLTYLKHLPAETLKIDRSFVHDMLTDSDDLAIVKGVIALAKAFRRKVTAEGVESLQHLNKLQRLGCDFAQGFGIAHPMPAKQMAAWLGAQG